MCECLVSVGICVAFKYLLNKFAILIIRFGSINSLSTSPFPEICPQTHTAPDSSWLNVEHRIILQTYAVNIRFGIELCWAEQILHFVSNNARACLLALPSSLPFSLSHTFSLGLSLLRCLIPVFWLNISGLVIIVYR